MFIISLLSVLLCTTVAYDHAVPQKAVDAETAVGWSEPVVHVLGPGSATQTVQGPGRATQTVQGPHSATVTFRTRAGGNDGGASGSHGGRCDQGDLNRGCQNLLVRGMGSMNEVVCNCGNRDQGTAPGCGCSSITLNYAFCSCMSDCRIGAWAGFCRNKYSTRQVMCANRMGMCDHDWTWEPFTSATVRQSRATRIKVEVEELPSEEWFSYPAHLSDWIDEQGGCQQVRFYQEWSDKGLGEQHCGDMVKTIRKAVAHWAHLPEILVGASHLKRVDTSCGADGGAYYEISLCFTPGKDLEWLDSQIASVKLPSSIAEPNLGHCWGSIPQSYFSGSRSDAILDQAAKQSFNFVGTGWCRPAGCDVKAKGCRVNGYYGDGSSPTDCEAKCRKDTGCTGYAISDPEYKKPNRCHVYTINSEVPSGMWRYKQTETIIATSNEEPHVECFAGTAPPILVLLKESSAGGEAALGYNGSAEEEEGTEIEVASPKTDCNKRPGCRWSPRGCKCKTMWDREETAVAEVELDAGDEVAVGCRRGYWHKQLHACVTKTSCQINGDSSCPYWDTFPCYRDGNDCDIAIFTQSICCYKNAAAEKAVGAERAVAKGPAFSKTTHKNTDPPNTHYHQGNAKREGRLHAEKAVESQVGGWSSEGGACGNGGVGKWLNSGKMSYQYCDWNCGKKACTDNGYQYRIDSTTQRGYQYICCSNTFPQTSGYSYHSASTSMLAFTDVSNDNLMLYGFAILGLSAVLFSAGKYFMKTQGDEFRAIV